MKVNILNIASTRVFFLYFVFLKLLRIFTKKTEWSKIFQFFCRHSSEFRQKKHGMHFWPTTWTMYRNLAIFLNLGLLLAIEYLKKQF
jgi:hypothetical protein